MNELHEANRRHWDARAAGWAHQLDPADTWRRCPGEPGLILDPRERQWLGDVAGKRIAVLGSGDNRVVFALAGLGAQVTSVDIAENQLVIARQRAAELGLTITFVRADVTDLHDLATGSFDVVYAGGHIAIWVADLPRFYGEAARVLRVGGQLMISEYHPFRRIWQDDRDRLVVGADYFHRGPYAYHDRGGPQYEFHWTVGDYVNAVLHSGCDLLTLEEFGTGTDGDWEVPPVGALPRVLLLVARRNASPR